MKNLMIEFKKFAMRGNVLDMAVGVIIGGAFGKIVTSLVNDIIMPLFAAILGKATFSDLSLTLGVNQAGEAILLKYGMFIQNILDFVIIAFCIFMMVRIANHLTKKEEPKKEVKISSADALLTEILSELKKK